MLKKWQKKPQHCKAEIRAKNKQTNIQTDNLISYVVWEGQIWCEIVYQKVLTSWSLSSVRDCLGSKKQKKTKNRSKIEEMLTDTGCLGLSVQKCACWLSVGKITARLSIVQYWSEYIIYTFTNHLLKKLLKSWIITLKGYLSLQCLKGGIRTSPSGKGIGL